ncbi:MAG: cytidine deaminase [Spirochaetales bacterium]|nr:cytidine deaminase [Spirochaetales bacterium]
MKPEELLKEAEKAAERSYSPYSNFNVGAALLCADGQVVTAGNIENRSYGLTICAERSAIVKAISMGQTKFSAMAVCCTKADYPVSPCGACRQVISEFTESDFPVYFSGMNLDDFVSTTTGELFPFDALSEMRDGKYNE